MANNRMKLKCNICGEVMKSSLCKYYPSTSWYLFAEKDYLNDFLEEHNHWDSEKVDPSIGNQEFTLEFEMKD